MSDGADKKQMKLRYAGVCRVCKAELRARVEAIYERSTRTRVLPRRRGRPVVFDG